jgi:hypothetical protein
LLWSYPAEPLHLCWLLTLKIDEWGRVGQRIPEHFSLPQEIFNVFVSSEANIPLHILAANPGVCLALALKSRIASVLCSAVPLCEQIMVCNVQTIVEVLKAVIGDAIKVRL